MGKKMRRIRDIEYTDYVQWAKMNTANRVYPCSIAEEFQTGDIYVNDDSVGEAVFLWHYCGFGYISGKASDTFLSEMMNQETS